MMMNLNKKKSHHSLINHILPASWISRFKPTKISCDRAASPEGRFYSADGDEDYWRLSFGDEQEAAMKMSHDVPQTRKKVREFAELKRQSLAAEADQKALFDTQPEKAICSTHNFCPKIASNSHTLNSKLRAVIVESENEHRRIRKCQKKRGGARSECKIKALEDIKKAKKMKQKKKNAREAETKKVMGLDGYAVIKNSVSPGEDFRESMVEMILEKDIERPEELEQLLACYLTLNDDKYHDLIVKVFREVWLQLNQISIASMLKDECFYQY